MRWRVDMADNGPFVTTYKKRFESGLDGYFETGFDLPDARINEFLCLKNLADPEGRSFARILEFPAESEILNRVYPGVLIDRADMIEGYYPFYATPPQITDFSLAGLRRGYYDAVLSLTPVHHAMDEEQVMFLRGAYERLKKNGVLAIGEVYKGSRVARFLDEFVDRNSSSSHKGNYPTVDFQERLTWAGFKRVETRIMSCPWEFKNQTQLIEFVSRIFYLKPIDPDLLLHSLNEWLGVVEHGDRISLNWELMYFKGVKTE